MEPFKPCLENIDKNQALIKSARPLSDIELKQLKAYYNIGLAYTSNALEGNSLTETETKVVIEDGLTIGGKPLRDHQEALGHNDAFNRLYELKKTQITETLIQELHHLFYYRINESQSGHYRQDKIIVSGSTYQFPLPQEIPSLMKHFISDLESHKKSHHPVEHAAYIHREFVTIHPFIDGNGRTARLLMNYSLLQDGYPITIIPPLLRTHYIDTLKEAQINKNTSHFDVFIMNLVLDSQKDFIRQFHIKGK